MEKNISKRVVAGTLALLTVFGSAPATLQGVFAPSTLMASAADGDDLAVTFADAADPYITSFSSKYGTGNPATYDGTGLANLLKAHDAAIPSQEGAVVTVTSKVPLVFGYTKSNDDASVGYTKNEMVTPLGYHNDVTGGEVLTQYAAPATLTYEAYQTIQAYADAQTYYARYKYTKDGEEPIFETNPADHAGYALEVKYTTDQLSGCDASVWDDFVSAGTANTALNNAAVKVWVTANYTRDSLLTNLTKAASATAAEYTAGTAYVSTSTAAPYTYQFVNKKGVTVNIATNRITLPDTNGATWKIKNVTVGQTDFTAQAAGNVDAVVGATYELQCTYPFTIDIDNDQAANDADDITAEYVELGKYVATVTVPAAAAGAVTVNDVPTEFTYANKGTELLATSTDGKTIKNASAASIKATYQKKETITRAQYDALTDKTGYTAIDGADLTKGYKKYVETNIANNGTVEYGEEGITLDVKLDTALLNESPKVTSGALKDNYKLYEVSVKKDDTEIDGYSGIIARANGAVYKADGNLKLNGVKLENITASGTYTATIKVWGADTANTVYTLNYTFTVGTAEIVSPQSVILTPMYSANLTGDYVAGDNLAKTKRQAVVDGETPVEFVSDGQKVVRINAALIASALKKDAYMDANFDNNGNEVGVVVNGNTYTDTKGTNVNGIDPALVSVVGETVGRELGEVHTIDILVADPNYGGSAANPKKITVKWKLVDPTVSDDFTFAAPAGGKINLNDVDAAGEVTPLEVEDVEEQVLDCITNLKGAVTKDAITFSYVECEAATEDEVLGGKNGNGVPTEEGWYKITAKFGDVSKTVKMQFFNNTAAKVTVYAVPAKESDYTFTYGDEFDPSGWKFYLTRNATDGSLSDEITGLEFAKAHPEDEDVTFTYMFTADASVDGNVAISDEDVPANETNKVHAGTYKVALKDMAFTDAKYEPAGSFTVVVAPKRLQDADIDEIVLTAVADGVTSIITSIYSGTTTNAAYIAGLKDKETNDVLGLYVVSGTTRVLGAAKDVAVTLATDNTNYTGLMNTTYTVAKASANYNMSLEGARVTANNKVKITAKRTLKQAGGDFTKSTKFGIVYAYVDETGLADNAAKIAAANEALTVDGQVAEDSTATLANSAATYEATITVTDATKALYARAFSVDEGGTVVYSDAQKVDITALLEAKVGDTLKIDNPVYISDNGTPKAYVYAQKATYTVGGEGTDKNDEITPVAFGVLVDNKNAVDGALELNKDGVVKGTSKGAGADYTANDYGAKIKVADPMAKIKVRPYIDFGNGAVVYAAPVVIESLNSVVTTKINLTNVNSSNVITSGTNKTYKAKMRVVRKKAAQTITVDNNDGAEIAAVGEGTAAKNMYVKTTLKNDGTTAAPVAHTTKYDLLVCGDADAFGVIVDKSAALKYNVGAALTDAQLAENAATEAALVVDGTYTKGQSKTPNAQTVTFADPEYWATANGAEIDEYDADNTYNELYNIYGATAISTNADHKVTVRAFVTYGTMTFYTTPVVYEIKDGHRSV